MMAKVKIKVLKQGLQQVLNSSSVENATLQVAQEIQRDLGTDYEAEVYDYGSVPRNRKVSVVKDTREGAFFIEANTGDMAKAVSKRTRG